MATDDEDKAFFKSFGAVMGVVTLIAISVLIIALVIGASQVPDHPTDAQVARIQQRTQPLGAENTSAEAAQQSVKQVSASSSGGESKALSAKEVYEQTCAACHGSGVMGAPKMGDAESWKPHAQKGLATLHKHAIEGFKAMPPKGGNSSLSDDEVDSAVNYMLEHSDSLDLAKSSGS